jgi:choline dehydrogenase-like flavoprotein
LVADRGRDDLVLAIAGQLEACNPSVLLPSNHRPDDVVGRHVDLLETLPDLDDPTRPHTSHVARLRARAEQSPNPESRLVLQRERDALGTPKVRLQWRLAALDTESVHRSTELVARELGRSLQGRGRVKVSVHPIGLPDHHMGTTRMHDDPRRGVVDAQCRVHGLSNLYVAGSSVFPTGGTANPTLTLLQMALRLADHLHETVPS